MKVAKKVKKFAPKRQTRPVFTKAVAYVNECKEATMTEI